MNNKGVGAIFCLIAALLISARYIAAAIFMSGLSVTWSEELYAAGLEYVGWPLPAMAAIALAAGIAFLAYGLYEDVKKR